MMYVRRRVTTKTVYELEDPETGQETLTAIERHVTEVVEPIDPTSARAATRGTLVGGLAVRLFGVHAECLIWRPHDSTVATVHE